ncbi:unnamed protein product [Cladocopium goreaui]|uniref:Uncharacterized protein n=1 Tax=Cladocopium goreaui TaxID=2562237 RepID=A0A9P1CTH0_9DINO|nr:unnamed protein product [Cladocopium goreaui]
MASGVNPLLALGLSTCVDIYADICDVLNGPAEQEQQCKENMKTELAALLGTPEDNHCSPTSLGCQHESIMDVVKVEEVSLQGPNFATWLEALLSLFHSLGFLRRFFLGQVSWMARHRP